MERIQGHQQHLEAQHCRVIDGVLPPCQPSRPLGWRLGVEGLQKDDLQQQGKYCGRILAHHRAKAARCGAWRVMSRRPHTLLEGRKELKEATVTEQPHQRNLWEEPNPPGNVCVCTSVCTWQAAVSKGTAAGVELAWRRPAVLRNP